MSRGRMTLITVDQFGSVLSVKAKGNSIAELKANASKQLRRNESITKVVKPIIGRE